MNQEKISADDDGRRLDRILRKAYPNVPPGAIAGAVRRGAVRLNGKRAGNDTRVSEGDLLTVPEWQESGREQNRFRDGEEQIRARLADNKIVSGEWDIPIIERTDDWIAVNKPAGIASHGKAGLDAIVRKVASQEGWWTESMSFRPGPIHRLDQNTSGVQLFSLSADGARLLTEQIRRRATSKVYLALVSGYLPRRTECRARLAYDRTKRIALAETTDHSLDGTHEQKGPRLKYSSALTYFYPLTFSADRSIGLVVAVPETGRTHQVRCHAATLGIPLLGDSKYGGALTDEFDSFILHAAFFGVHAPVNGWTAPLASATFGFLRTQFGDLAGIERRLKEILPSACTGFPGTVTIEL